MITFSDKGMTWHGIAPQHDCNEEYNDNELHRLVEVAMANTSLEDVPRMQPRLLRGLTSDTTNDWVTMGFPDLPQMLDRLELRVVMG